jgi:hypothetical protein
VRRASGTVTEEQRSSGDPLVRLAESIVSKGLGTPAILFFESTRPLGFVASQAVRVAEPLLGLFFRPASVDAVAAAMEDRDGIERLLKEIERLQAGGGDRDGS